jgi:phosphate transport system protein
MIKQHTNREYENELMHLRERIIQMAFRVQEMIDQSITALIQSDVELARHTIGTDKLVNKDEKEIDELCLILLAKRQPLGTDLRLIAIVLKMVTDLERIGDLAVNICERAIKLHKISAVVSLTLISQMAKIIQGMVSEVIESIINLDVGRAEAIIARDDEVDELYHLALRETLIIMLQKEDLIEPLIQIQSVAKWLERIGDHCTNLAEKVVFVVRGTDIRHMSKK